MLRIALHWQILAGMIAGCLLGLVLNLTASDRSVTVTNNLPDGILEAEVTDSSVTLYHGRLRKTKATPRECPLAPHDYERYTGDRIIEGTYDDGSPCLIHDKDWIHGTHTEELSGP